MKNISKLKNIYRYTQKNIVSKL